MTTEDSTWILCQPRFLSLLLLIVITITGSGESSFAPRTSHYVAAEVRGPEGCHLPSAWEGNWFQSGVHQTITISRNTISTKGRCLEADGEKYLVHNEKDDCYRCLVFTAKHHNVLQYKETFCVPERGSLRSLCSTITGDANLFSMFRLDPVPIDCPFRAPFTFTYNRGYGDCRNPVSTVESCIHSTRLTLHYQACPDVPGTESTVEELQCLASWKEGSSRYLLGLIQYQHHASYEERFRCFVYEKIKKGNVIPSSVGIGSFGLLGGSSSAALIGMNSNSSSDIAMYRVAQSGDATCNGLSPVEGSRTMTLKRALSPKACQMPSWLVKHSQWHTLDQRSTYAFDNSGLRVSNASDSAGIRPNTLILTAICSQILENPTLDKVTLVLHVTSECNIGYVCTSIYKRDSHIMEIQMGTRARRAEDACHSSHFNHSLIPYVTLISPIPPNRRCPIMGHFTVSDFTRDGLRLIDRCTDAFHTLSIGCNNLETLEFRSECPTTSVIAEYSCHGWWEEHGINYLITTPLSRASNSARRYCFIYREAPSRYEAKRLKHRNSYLEDDTSILLEDNSNNYGKFYMFSSISDSCRRNVVHGIEGSLAFNVTSHGRCGVNAAIRFAKLMINANPANVCARSNLNKCFCIL